MPPPNNPLVCKVAMVYQHDTRQFVNTFHVVGNPDWDIIAMTALANLFKDWWNGPGKAGVTSATQLTQIQVRKYDPAEPLAVDLPVSPPIAGGQTGSPLPGSITSTISWRTGLAGKKYRGRSYMPGYPESQVADDDRLTSALVNLLASAALELLLDLLAESLGLAVFHRSTNTFTPITQYVVENIVDNQRRRLPARGR